ncbi:hypothetical protein GCM10020220_101850 [Nonomuraea rubra]
MNGVEQAASGPSLRFAGGNYLDVPISRPGSTYTAGDASVGDADGATAQYEIFLKWDPSDQKDNSQSGVTSNVYIDATGSTASGCGASTWAATSGRRALHAVPGLRLRRRRPGRAGGQDLATAPSPAPADDPATRGADHRNSSGYIITGPEYLTMFNGLTGAAMSTVNFDPARGNINDWGDNYGNRGDRFLAGTAYLDGQRPSLIMGRGYYARARSRPGTSATAGSPGAGSSTPAARRQPVDRTRRTLAVHRRRRRQRHRRGRLRRHDHQRQRHRPLHHQLLRPRRRPARRETSCPAVPARRSG